MERGAVRTVWPCEVDGHGYTRDQQFKWASLKADMIKGRRNAYRGEEKGRNVEGRMFTCTKMGGKYRRGGADAVFMCGLRSQGFKVEASVGLAGSG